MICTHTWIIIPVSVIDFQRRSFFWDDDVLSRVRTAPATEYILGRVSRMWHHLLWEEEWLRTKGMLGIYSSLYYKIYGKPDQEKGTYLCHISEVGLPTQYQRCTSFYCAWVYCVFYRLKVYGNPVLIKSTNIIFPIVIAHFMSLCHVLITLAKFQTLHQ